MVRHMMVILALSLPVGAAAGDPEWRPMTGPQITAALIGNVLDYGDKWQDFRASGRTLYFAGSESWGYWGVREDRYCSMWPPSDLWACYDMQRAGDRLRFVGDAGDITDAVVHGLIE